MSGIKGKSGVYQRTDKMKKNKGHPQNSETRGKIRNSMKGRKQYEMTPEIRKKMSLAKIGVFKGERSPLWIKDRTLLKKRQERNDVAYQEWRMKVWQRDEFKCKMFNENCEGSIIAHHILPWRDYVELRYEINNGITLCHAHHPRKRAEEKLLSPYLQDLVSSSNELI